MSNGEQPASKGHVAPSDDDDAEGGGEYGPYELHLLDAGHQSSRDFDAWILKLGTAGITLVTAVAVLVDAGSWWRLVWSGGLFAGSLLAGLMSQRLSADGIREMQSGSQYDDVGVFNWVKWLNWGAAVLMFAAYIFLALQLGESSIREVQR